MIATESIRRLVVRLPNWVGDVVHSLPALAALRAHFPSAHITALARGEVGALLERHPSVDRVIAYPSARGLRAVAQLRQAAGRVQREQFDLGIVLPNSFESACLFFLAGIPRRYGFATDGRGWLLTHGQPCPPELRRLHQADYYLALLNGLGITAERTPQPLGIGPEERQAAMERLKAAGWDRSRPLAAICPGAGYGSAKRWPLERYAGLGDRLSRERRWQVVALGGPGERPLGASLAGRIGGLIDLTGRTSLREAMAVISCCRAVVSNDSGLLHVATALGVESVGIFGPTDPRRTGPTGPSVTVVRRSVLCSPCELRECPIDHRCMEWISVEEVLAALTAEAPACGIGPMAPIARPAVFLDRDGTLNRDLGYLNDPQQFELLPGVAEAVRALNEAGFLAVVVTNQSGIGRGMITEAQLEAIHRRLREALGAAGATIDAIFHCPHAPEAGCDCRKPAAGLVLRACAGLAIDRERSIVVGDKLADVQLARAVGAAAILVRGGHGEATWRSWPEGEPPPDFVADDLPAAVRWILERAPASPTQVGG